MNKKVISVYDDSNKRLVKNTGLFSYLYVGSYGGITMWGFIVALVSGALMSIQGVFNTEVTKQTSVWVAAGWVQLTAFITCVVIWLFTGREPVAGLMQVTPKYVLVGGIMGALITYTVIRSMGSLGPAKAALLIVVSQIIIAYAIELFGLFGVEKAPFCVEQDNRGGHCHRRNCNF